MTQTEQEQQLEQWALVELLGHRRLAGRVSEETVAGGPTLRIDVFVGKEIEATLTQNYAHAALYCVTPITEALARRFSVQNVPQPISRWDLPEALEPPRDEIEVAEIVDDDDTMRLLR